MPRIFRYKMQEIGVRQSADEPARYRTVTAQSENHALHQVRHHLTGGRWIILKVESIELNDVPDGFIPPKFIFDKRNGVYKSILGHCDDVKKHARHMYYTPSGKKKACGGEALSYHFAYYLRDGRVADRTQCECSIGENHYVGLSPSTDTIA